MLLSYETTALKNHCDAPGTSHKAAASRPPVQDSAQPMVCLCRNSASPSACARENVVSTICSFPGRGVDILHKGEENSQKNERWTIPV